VAAASLFAEHAAPGLIELFAGRADDLDVELSVRSPHQFSTLLLARAVDVAIGPAAQGVDPSIICRPFLNYQIVVVAGPDHPLSKVRAGPSQLREQTWLLGPSAASEAGVVPTMLRRINVPESRQRIFQSHAAALEEAKRNNGLALAVSFAVAHDLAAGGLVRVVGPALQTDGVWNALTLAEQSAMSATAELMRFVTTPRATQAMLRGSGVNVGHFRPSVHVTLWS
jgi:DNA-binding transcriptional LysR family regulator